MGVKIDESGKNEQQVAHRATIAHLSPMMLHIKFDQDWPTGFRDIQVQKCEIFVTQGRVTPK